MRSSCGSGMFVRGASPAGFQLLRLSVGRRDHYFFPSSLFWRIRLLIIYPFAGVLSRDFCIILSRVLHFIGAFFWGFPNSGIHRDDYQSPAGQCCNNMKPMRKRPCGPHPSPSVTPSPRGRRLLPSAAPKASPFGRSWPRSGLMRARYKVPITQSRCEIAAAHGHDKSCPYAEICKFPPRPKYLSWGEGGREADG
jgi:hypothetical protein